MRFYGGAAEGLRALSAAIAARLPIGQLRRTWPVLDNEPTGPWWELTFTHTMSPSGDLDVVYRRPC